MLSAKANKGLYTTYTRPTYRLKTQLYEQNSITVQTDTLTLPRSLKLFFKCLHETIRNNINSLSFFPVL